MRPQLLWPVTLSVLSACTTVLGIDGDYQLGSTGGDATGGRATAGGPPSAGGIGSGGASGGAGSGGLPTGGTDNSGGLTGGSSGAPVAVPDGEAPCPTGQKRCTVLGEERCVAPDPSVGCGLADCEQCPAPVGGFGVCAGTECDFDCFAGFARNGASCEPIQTDSGSGGSTGAGGATGRCTRDADCPRCGPTLGCCALVPPNRCGCNFVWCAVF